MIEQARRMAGNQDGVITVVVLWICAIVMWFAFQISVETRLKGEEQIHMFRRTQALYLAIGGCYEALGRMGQATSLGLDRMDGKWRTGKVQHKGDRRDPKTDDWLPDGYPRVVDFQTGQALVIIEQENKKVNVNKANQGQLKQVLQKGGLDEGNSDRLSDIIMDFIDKDDQVRLHGAEKDHYKSLAPYGPFNGPLTSIDQLLLIPGITQQLFYGFGLESEELEEEKGDSGIPPIPELPSKYSLFSLLTVYGSNTTFKDEQKTQLDDLTEEAAEWKPGQIYRILSCGKSFAGSPTVLMWLTIRLSPQSDDGYEVLYRRIL